MAKANQEVSCYPTVCTKNRGASAVKKSYSRTNYKRALLVAKLHKSLRSLLVFTLVALVIFFISTFTAGFIKPYLITYNESREIAKIKKQIAEAKAENARLKRELAYLKTPLGKEVEARKQGWVRPGEIAVILESPSSSTIRKESVQANNQSTFLQKTWQVIKETFTLDKH